MRTSVAIVTGIVIGAASAAGVYVAVQHSRSWQDGARDAVAPPTAAPFRSTAPVDADAAPNDAASSRSPGAVPVTPVYRPTPEAPPIYRCTSRAGTVYSNEPCAGASVVDARAVAGYDSRPSDRLARLVAAGRTADASAPPVSTRSIAPVESAECANLRQQIVDLDAAALRPSSPRALDELRRIRQDIRTSMARIHC